MKLEPADGFEPTITALCPFHDEAKPSFVADRDSQTFRCEGCGANGDVFRFIMRYEHVDFVRSLEKLAMRAGVRLEIQGDGDLPPQYRPAHR
ncbi:MAG: hypothetical protein H0V56_04190 [Chthoniobacterales bacterium]|nr:hypothetical protein [Chthoniobacterales bacterium]